MSSYSYKPPSMALSSSPPKPSSSNSVISHGLGSKPPSSEPKIPGIAPPPVPERVPVQSDSSKVLPAIKDVLEQNIEPGNEPVVPLLLSAAARNSESIIMKSYEQAMRHEYAVAEGMAYNIFKVMVEMVSNLILPIEQSLTFQRPPTFTQKVEQILSSKYHISTTVHSMQFMGNSNDKIELRFSKKPPPTDYSSSISSPKYVSPFVSANLEEFQCSLCFANTIHKRLDPCGHCYCEECAQKQFDSANKKCMKCQTGIKELQTMFL